MSPYGCGQGGRHEHPPHGYTVYGCPPHSHPPHNRPPQACPPRPMFPRMRRGGAGCGGARKPMIAWLLMAAGLMLVAICVPLCFWPAALGIALIVMGALALRGR